jgi:dipeptidyl aminopeptidase/acylaminoacyl peptidase
MQTRFRAVIATLFALTLACVPAPALAQYFGQNKVQYEKFKFEVLKTEHFDIYYYPIEADAAREAGRLAERWYVRLSKVLNHQLNGRQPIIFYASHPDFRQTNVIEGELGEGTGGVTESAKRRVTMPFAATPAETDHVLGHELVHAFQYDMLGRVTEAMPLWFIEGMAEYLSLGARDVQTAMWLRDSALLKKLPDLEQLEDPRYFPYRFGHAFWAYVAGRWGDEAIGRILDTVRAPSEQTIARAGDPISAIESTTQLDRKTLAAAWHSAINETYMLVPGPEVGQLVGDRAKDGSFSVGPALSPDGTRVAFLSSRDVLSIDLFLADAATGKIIKKVISTASDPHFESLQFLASAGSWAPDSKRLAIATLRNGKPVLALVNANNGDIEQEIKFDTFGEIFQPSWSPDGQSIALSVQVGGYTDLYLHTLATGQTRQLTRDTYADLQPAWSPDGSEIAFVSDRFSASGPASSFSMYRLAKLTVATGAIAPIETGLTGDAINPQWTDSGALYFISDAEGRRNAYRLDRGAPRAVRVTSEITGVAGITPLSPALSVGRNGKAAFSVFRDSGYEIRVATIDQPADTTARLTDQGLLPPGNRELTTITQLLQDPSIGLPPPTTEFEKEEYKSKLELIDVSQSIGATTGQFGTFAQGGIQLTFSDLLGNHVLATGFGINGGAKDFLGSVTYLNRSHRWNWGLFGNHTPLVTGGVATGITTINGRPVYVQETQLVRQYFTEVGALTAYPFSKSARFEFSASVNRIGFGNEVRTQMFDAETGDTIFDETQDLGAAPSLLLQQVSAALVRDTSTTGPVSPIMGERLRLEMAPMFGDLTMTNFTADYRRYVMPIRPITFAGRAFHYGRYGSGSEDERLSPIYLGYPTLVRGYDVNSFTAEDCVANATSSCPQFDRLVGSRVLVFNGEVRAPLASLWTGRLDYGPLPAELFGFVDTGVAWSRGDRVPITNAAHQWVTSVGGGARVNVMGYLIAEFNMAKPIDRPGRGWMFVFNLMPGF